MFKLKHRSLWLIPVLAGCVAFFAGCKKQTDQSNPGPGQEDDRPVTMSEGSFTFRWYVKGNPSDNGFENENGRYRHSILAKTNRVKCTFGAATFTLARKTGKPLVITYTLNSSPVDVVQMGTNSEGRHLTVPALHTFVPAGSDGKQHPDAAAKIKTVTFDNVVVVPPNPPDPPDPLAGTGCTQTGDRVTCSIESAATKSVELKVCRKPIGECASNSTMP